jgi:hypothetical protein
MEQCSICLEGLDNDVTFGDPIATLSAPSRRRVVSAPPPREHDDVDLDRTAAYLQTAATPADAEGFRAAAGLALACLDAVAQP